MTFVDGHLLSEFLDLGAKLFTVPRVLPLGCLLTFHNLVDNNHHHRRCCPQRKIIIIHSLWLALREETRRELQIDTFCPIYFDYHDFVVMIMMVMWMIMVIVISLCRRRWKQIVEEYIRSPHAESMRKRNWWELKYKQIVRYANTHAASSLFCFHWLKFDWRGVCEFLALLHSSCTLYSVHPKQVTNFRQATPA